MITPFRISVYILLLRWNSCCVLKKCPRFRGVRCDSFLGECHSAFQRPTLLAILSVFAWILSNPADILSVSGNILSVPNIILSVSPFIPANPILRGHTDDHSFCFRLDSFQFSRESFLFWRYSVRSEQYSFRFPVYSCQPTFPWPPCGSFFLFSPGFFLFQPIFFPIRTLFFPFPDYSCQTTYSNLPRL